MRLRDSLLLVLLALCAAPLCTAPAWADTSLEVVNGTKLKSSLRPASEVETFLFSAPKGALLTIKATSKGKGPPLDVHLFDPTDAEIAQTSFQERGLGALLKKFPLESSGMHRLTVSVRGSANEGDYGLKIGWKAQKSVSEDLEFVVDAFSGAPVPFSADAGATAKFKAVAGNGSLAVPVITALLGPDGFSVDFSGVGKRASDATGRVVLPSTGEYRLLVDDSNNQGGVVQVSAKLKAPKLGKRKFDFRSRVIGGEDGDEVVVGSVVGSVGGSITVPFILPGGGTSSISGSGVSVPAGALGLPTAIVVGSAASIESNKGTEFGVGPSVFLGPEGQKFATPVTVTIPFDAAAVSGDVADLQILTRDARGKITVVPGPYTVNEVDGTVSFPASHFSAFRVVDPGFLANLPFAGAWKEDSGSPGFNSFLRIFANGRIDDYFEENFDGERFCFLSRGVSPPGTDLSLFFSIVDNRLIDEFQREYTRINVNKLPRNCDEEF